VSQQTCSTHGSAATTLADVRKTKVSSSQLYHYFGDKQDLVRAVVDHQASIVIANQRALNLSTVEAFREWKDALTAGEAAMHGRGGCPLGSLGAELAATDPVGRDRVAAGFQRWSRVIELGLANVQHDGGPSPMTSTRNGSPSISLPPYRVAYSWATSNRTPTRSQRRLTWWSTVSKPSPCEQHLSDQPRSHTSAV
jgi:AcrR family transcriptional regulator